MTLPPAAGPSRRREASSPWSSEEGCEFLQQRLSKFARTVFVMSTGYFVAFWIVGIV